MATQAIRLEESQSWFQITKPWTWTKESEKARRRRLVAAAQHGDRDAFSELWLEHAPQLRAILLSMVTDQDAEDLLQDVALQSWKSLASLNHPDRLSPWLCTIARNLGRDALATQRFRPSSEALIDPLVEPRSEVSPAAQTEADEIMSSMRELPEAYREVLTLRLLMDLTGPEIAKLTGHSSGSVRVNLCRGMKLLRERLEMKGVSP